MHRETVRPSPPARLASANVLTPGLPLAGVLPWLIVVLLAATAFGVFQTPVLRAELVAQWFSPAWETRAALHLHRALGERGVDPAVPAGVQVDGESFVIGLNAGESLQLRWDPAVPQDSPVLFWTCGHARFQDPPTADTPLPTHINPEWLPPICRNLP